MFQIDKVLGENNSLVNFPGQFLESGVKLELLSGVAIFGKLDFEEVEPIFWFHLLEGANLNLGALHCGKMGLAQLQAQQKGGGSKNGLGTLMCDWNNWQGVFL